MDMNQYLDMFIEESKENLQYMNENLLNLEKNAEDKNLLNEIFRVAHTLKGMSGTMGFSKIASLTHEMENLLQAIRNDEIKVSSNIIDILFRCFDTLDEYIANIGEIGKEGNLDSTDLVELLNNTINNKQGSDVNLNSELGSEKSYQFDEYVRKALYNAKTKGLNIFNIDVKLSKECMLKSARAFIVFNTLESHSEIIQSNPPAEDIEDEKFDSLFSLTIVSNKEIEEIKQQLISISEVEDVQINEIHLDQNTTMEEIAVASEQPVTNSVKLSEDSTNESDEKKGKSNNFINHEKKKQSSKIGKTVRVDIDRLDNLMNLVSELIIIKTRLEDSDSTSKDNMNEAIEYLERITTSLHDAVMKVRMVPIERVFNRFPRMVRDLSRELGKEIDLQMSGEETEVDRTIIDEIGDPLIHLIRNSIDHGIESPEIRKNSGKNETGVLKLKAYPDGNTVVIELDDDGAGINIDKVKKKAVERGLLTSSESEGISEDEAVGLLFRPGFSTADTISDVSGRGVGLDVVKTKIESINGVVEVETKKGVGTKFIIRLPLTLAIIQALLINLSTEIYAIPLSSIREITPVLSKDIRKVQNQEVVLFRNKTLPIIRLNKILGIDDMEENEEIIMVIVKKGDKEAGLIVDKLIGQQEIVIKSLGRFLSGIQHLAGATILGNGRISLILDVNSLF
ncbi:chemotaxis protein CheW [Brassicibacter mesophilus]|uniref:chemotaxis protein CheW n=1 Tax=Brassicibacter mesophilus TaxID=745119 RepID=UPI003D232BD2